MLCKMWVIIQYSRSAPSRGRGLKSQANVKQPLANTNECIEATQFKLTFSTNKGNSTLFNNWKIPVAWTYIMTGSKNLPCSACCGFHGWSLLNYSLETVNSSYCGYGCFFCRSQGCHGSVRRGCDMILTGSSPVLTCITWGWENENVLL